MEKYENTKIYNLPITNTFINFNINIILLRKNNLTTLNAMYIIIY